MGNFFKRNVYLSGNEINYLKVGVNDTYRTAQEDNMQEMLYGRYIYNIILEGENIISYKTSYKKIETLCEWNNYALSLDNDVKCLPSVDILNKEIINDTIPNYYFLPEIENKLLRNYLKRV